MLPNRVLQERRLSYTARGLLADLLSRPDGWREDGRHMADTSPQGRGAVRKALKELTEAGFYRVEKVRLPDGTFRTRTHVYDTPQLVAPDVTRPVPGAATAGAADTPLVKKRDQGPTLPAAPAPAAPAAPAVPDAGVRAAVATLFRVIRPEPRLRLGETEAVALAPLVAQWLARGSSDADLRHALLPGLPARVHSAVAVLRSRLERKMPPAETVRESRSSKPRYAECDQCHDPVPAPGTCGACSGRHAGGIATADDAEIARVGAARARTALRAARTGPLAFA